MKMSNKAYDVLKYIAQIVLPAIASFYFGLANLWGLPFGEEVVGTITLIDTLIGALLMISSAKYNKTKNNNDIGIGIEIDIEEDE